MTRKLKGLLGAFLLSVGLLGAVMLGPWSAFASGTRSGGNHDTMDRMMDAMHGPGTSARMHRILGAEQMMAQCASMMDSMGQMMSRMAGTTSGGMMPP